MNESKKEDEKKSLIDQLLFGNSRCVIGANESTGTGPFSKEN